MGGRADARGQGGSGSERPRRIGTRLDRRRGRRELFSRSASDGVRAVPRFRSEAETRPDDDDDDDASDAFTFRDVLLRSRALENLVASFARAPAGDDAETAAFTDFVDALVWPAGPRADETTSSGCNASSIAALLVSCVARAGAALRDPKRTAEVQLGDDALAEMLAACAGSVKRVGAAETLRRRELRLRAASDANAATVRALSGGAESRGGASFGATFDPSSAAARGVGARPDSAPQATPTPPRCAR